MTVTYRINDGVVTLENNYRILSDINLNNVPPFFKQPMGISSIEYDHYNNRFLILTSYESPEKVGGYLWSASIKDLENNKMTLVRNSAGNPIAFSNKSEDVAVINKRRVIVIFDDDRLQTFIGVNTASRTRLDLVWWILNDVFCIAETRRGPPKNCKEESLC